MKNLRLSWKISRLSRKIFAVMLIGVLTIGGAATAFASDTYTSEKRNHGTISITAENETNNTINMKLGDTITVTVSPYIHVQYEGCGTTPNCPDVCGDMPGSCFIKNYGCNCSTSPTKRITKVETAVTKEGIISVGEANALDNINDKPTVNDLASKSDGTFTITADSVGTTELTVETSLRDWVSSTKKYTVKVDENDSQVAEVIDFDAETTHAGFEPGETNTVQTLFVDLTFEKEMKIVDKEKLLTEMNILSDAYVSAQSSGKLEEGNSFVVFGAGLKPDQTNVELTNNNKTLRITTKGWGAQVAGIFKASGTWKNLKSIDGENADINVTIIVPNGITTEIVKQVVATNDINASVTTKVIRPEDATRGMVHWMLLKNGDPVKAKYESGLGFNQVGATFNAHLHNFATDMAEDFAKNSVNTMMPMLGDYYDIDYKEGSDEFTVTAKESQPGDVLELHIYSYLNNGSKTINLDDLEKGISSAENIDKDLYTEESYKVFSDALAKAQIIDKAPKYYAQTDVDFAAKQLLNAQGELVAVDQKDPIIPEEDNPQQGGGNTDQNQVNENNNNGDKSAETGDGSFAGVYAVLMVAAACIAGKVLYRKKYPKV